jgi:hypothetical protein
VTSAISISNSAVKIAEPHEQMNRRVRRFDMKSFYKPLLLLAASAMLASCGGGGSGSHSAFTPPGSDTVISLSATTLTLPVSPYTVSDEQDPTKNFPGNFPGSPYISDVTVTWRHKNGDIVVGTSKANVSVTPVETITYSTLNSTDNTGTGGVDQFHTLLGSGSVDVTAGVGTIFIHAGQTPGQGTLTVSAVDPVSNQPVSAQLVITVAGGSSGVPGSISISTPTGVYVQSSGGAQSALVSATLKDGSGALLSAPSGASNVQFSIVGPVGNDATLSGVDGSGASHTGTTINAASHNGIASVTFNAGTQQGAVQVQATADRGDNNVDNGISSPISSTGTVNVSDGKLDSLTLTFNGSGAAAILVNGVSGAVSTDGSAIPPDPNATYSLTVTVQGTDRFGGPVLPGTQIRFGAIDTPLNADGFFAISGNQGDPEEGGIHFSATDGHFKTAGGGAGPGDTLLVIGKQEQGAPDGNADLESASKVVTVISETQLTVSTPFNLNDTTGTSVNHGPVLPYIVGRAGIGTITSPALTNANGAASTTLNYPVSKLGHIVAIYAQGNGTDYVTNQSKLVTDIAIIGFPGLAPAHIFVSPTPLPGNTTVPLQACITDDLGSPVANEVLTFVFKGLETGTGSVGGVTGGGIIPGVTDQNGCINTTATTTGIGSTGTPILEVSGGGQSTDDPIVASGDVVLFALPSQLGGDGGTVTLVLLNGNGTPVPGVQLGGTCTAGAGLTSVIPVTNAQGKATTTITANLNIPNKPGTASCTFTAPGGTPSAIVNLTGTDPCANSGASPANPACTGTTAGQSTLALTVSGPPAAATSVVSNPGGAGCSSGTGTATTCNDTLGGGTYSLTANRAGTWTGSCVPSGTSPTSKATLSVSSTASSLTCTFVGQ